MSKAASRFVAVVAVIALVALPFASSSVACDGTKNTSAMKASQKADCSSKSTVQSASMDAKSGSCPVTGATSACASSDCADKASCEDCAAGACDSSCDHASKAMHAMAESMEGNVWVTKDGTKYFTCPVKGTEAKVEAAAAVSVVNGQKYYHCCPSSQGPFRANSESFLKNFAVPANVESVDTKGMKHFVDPVTGKTGVVDEKTKYVDMQHHRYYFSSKSSLKKFEASPDTYLSSANRI